MTAPLAPSFDGVAPVLPAPDPVDPAVRLAHVTKRYGSGPVVLDDVSCTTKTIADFPRLWEGLVGG